MVSITFPRTYSIFYHVLRWSKKYNYRIEYNMAFNPTRYETLYGFDILDTFHNFFPEIMYDDTLFHGDMENWVRHRISVLFPTQYVRHQNMYRIYHANESRNRYNQWRNTVPADLHIPTTQTAQPIRIPSVQATYTATPVLTTPMRPRLRRVVRDVDLGVENLFTTVLNGLIEQEFYAPQEDVVVAPTAQQIQAGSRLVNSANIPTGTTCAICQEDSPNVPSWRILRCTHSFHKDCVDTWFRQNVHCPVCRADIRETPAR